MTYSSKNATIIDSSRNAKMMDSSRNATVIDSFRKATIIEAPSYGNIRKGFNSLDITIT